MKRIYFGVGGQYGDIMMGEPSLRKLIKMNPDAEFVVGVSSKYEDILPIFYNYHPQVIDYKIWDAYPIRPSKFSEDDKKYIEKMKFDEMYNDMDKHTSPTWALKNHQVKEQGLIFGIEIDSSDIRLKRPDDIVKKDKTVAISLFPDSNKNGVKSIGLNRVQKIVSFVCSLGYKVIHLNGPNEPDIDGAIKVNVPYWKAVREMLDTDLLITGDTGMSWVASAYNHPVVGLCAIGYWKCCMTSVNWQPINENAIYLESWKASEIPMDKIFASINNKLGV